MTNANQFRRVFAEPRRTGRSGFVVLYRPNGLDAARLGLAIAKKRARRAVDRNRLKRIARESFRIHCSTLPGVDIVVLCSAGATAEPNRRLFDALEQAWATIRKSSCVES
ncbi:ribonuclease P protein component [Thiocystis violacea]|uniref:ribonuclease P protein component n=1 Tax=Thiocystis violacea TaxID=13725 RepID=UPI001F5B1302|nr:ribonuclease P protein component [Thiocystis violacea]